MVPRQTLTPIDLCWPQDPVQNTRSEKSPVVRTSLSLRCISISLVYVYVYVYVPVLPRGLTRDYQRPFVLPQRFAFELKHQAHLITPGSQLFEAGNTLFAFEPTRLANFGVD